MRSEFDGSTGFFESEEGSARNMTMLYGLSDFWHLLFEDSEKIDLLMEANAIIASDVYSKFLQLTSSITLENIQKNIGTQLKLVLLSREDYVQGTLATYRLPDGLQDTRYLANRPFLATVTYEDSTNYLIDIDANTIQFASDPFEDKFPRRINSNNFDEIAMWAIDVETDEKMMYNYYGKLIGVDPQESTDKYKDFLYGLFYLYVHGPDLAMVRRGLNVALGVPLARDNETVLSIRKYPGSGQYFVITDLNSYILPFGLIPTVAEGDTLTVGDEVTTWVEVKDYINDGDWWINLEIPKSLMPYVPEDQPDAYAKPGTYADYLMRTYLRHHTFLVKVNVTTFKNIESFQQLGDIIKRVKPSYTTPIYIWSVPIEDEIIRLIEEETSSRRDASRSELFFAQIGRMRRNAQDPVHRGCPKWIRTNLGQHECAVLGLDAYSNGIPSLVANGTATGFINRPGALRENTGYEKGLLRAKFRRNDRNVPHLRSKISYARNVQATGHTGETYNPWPEYIPAGMWSVPLYITTLADLQDRFRSITVQVPEGGPVFTLMQPFLTDGGINDVGINEGIRYSQYQLMIAQYSTVFTKGPKGNYVGNFVPDSAKATYKPPVTAIGENDYFLCTQIYEQTYAVYWITSSYSGSALNYKSVFLCADTDTIKIAQDNMPMTRGLAPAINAPIYMTRGGTLIKTTVEVIDPYPTGGMIVNDGVVVVIQPPPESLVVSDVVIVAEIGPGDYVPADIPPQANTTPTLSYAINEIGINEDGVSGYKNTILYSDLINLDVPKMRASAKIKVDAILGADINPPG